MKTDTLILQDVVEQFKWEPWLDAAAINVAVKHGAVILSGKVDSYYKKLMIAHAAQKVAGVKAVINDITVSILPGFSKTDAAISSAAWDTLKWNTAVPEHQLTIKVKDGVVILEGEVDWDFQRTAAEDAVGKLAGVRDIINCITLKSFPVPANIKQQIRSAFHRSATIDAEQIGVEVVGNRVILTGKVRSLAERKDAEDAACLAPGIHTVESRLELEEKEWV